MNKPTLELSMIIRDEAHTLRRCLNSVAGLVDRIVVGDTGSTDDSKVIARSFGAEVIDVPWTNDFAAARNHVLGESKSDWILVLDADEALDSRVIRPVLREMLEDKSVDIFGFWRNDYLSQNSRQSRYFEVHCNKGEFAPARSYPTFSRSHHVRLFRKSANLAFVRKVHENLNFRGKLELDRIALAPFVIHHFGIADANSEKKRSKSWYYRELCRDVLSEDPTDGQMHLQLGIMELVERGPTDCALSHFRKAKEVQPLDSAISFYEGLCYLGRGEGQAAKESLLVAQCLGETTALLEESLGDAYLYLGEHGNALKSYEQSTKRSLRTALLESKIGLAQVHLGEVKSGLMRINHAIEGSPRSPIMQGFLRIAEDLASGGMDMTIN